MRNQHEGNVHFMFIIMCIFYYLTVMKEAANNFSIGENFLVFNAFHLAFSKSDITILGLIFMIFVTFLNTSI